MIDCNDMSTSLRLFYAWRLGNCIHYMFIFAFLVQSFLKSFFLHSFMVIWRDHTIMINSFSQYTLTFRSKLVLLLILKIASVLLKYFFFLRYWEFSLVKWLIDLNGMSNHLGLIDAQRLDYGIHYTFISIFFV